jgi:hypothetical protein
MDTYGFLYNDSFNPIYPYRNLFMRDDDGAGYGQFKLTTFFEANITYVLVVTTFERLESGSFSIFTSGPNDVRLNPIPDGT